LTTCVPRYIDIKDPDLHKTTAELLLVLHRRGANEDMTNRKLKVCMEFGATEIRLSAWDITPHKCPVPVTASLKFAQG